MAGSICYLISATASEWFEDDVALSIGADFAASHIFLIDSWICVLSNWRYKVDVAGTEDDVFMFTVHLSQLDWTGWGDWLFFVGSVLYALNSYLGQMSLNYDLIDNINLAAAVLFLVGAQEMSCVLCAMLTCWWQTRFCTLSGAT